MSADLLFPGSAVARARVYAGMGATGRAIDLLKRALAQNPAAGDALSCLVELYRRTHDRWNEFEANKICRDYLSRNSADKQAPGLVMGLVDFYRLSPLDTLEVCEDIAALDPSQRTAIHQVYRTILQREPAPVITEEAALMMGTAGYWPPERPSLENMERELYLIHTSIDDGNEPAAIDHLQQAVPGPLLTVPLLRAWRRFLASECGRGAEGRYPELAGRMAELEKRQDTR